MQLVCCFVGTTAAKGVEGQVERAKRLTVASPSRRKLDTKGNWKLPVKLSSPSPCLAWEKSSPAGSAERPALGSCPHLVDCKRPAAREDKGEEALAKCNSRRKCKGFNI